MAQVTESDLFTRDSTAVMFESMAHFDSAAESVTPTLDQYVSINYTMPTFWERLKLLFFGFQPHEILEPRVVTLAELIVSSLEIEPQAWSASGQMENYYIQHDNGIQLWIANQYYGISIYNDRSVKFSEKEKTVLWKAYQQWVQRTGSVSSTTSMGKMSSNRRVLEYAKARTHLMDGSL